jgi:hypothetical protein
MHSSTRKNLNSKDVNSFAAKDAEDAEDAKEIQGKIFIADSMAFRGADLSVVDFASPFESNFLSLLGALRVLGG